MLNDVGRKQTSHSSNQFIDRVDQITSKLSSRIPRSSLAEFGFLSAMRMDDRPEGWPF